MSDYEMTELELAELYRNGGNNPSGVFQNKDGSGYVVFEDGKEFELSTDADVKRFADRYGIDIDETGM